MAWTERLPSGKYRGCWRDPAGRKQYTRRPEFPEHPYARRRDAREAAQEAEAKARRTAAVAARTISASITFGEWWEHTSPSSDTSNVEVSAESIARLYLTPKWGEVPLNQIQQRDVKAWVADLAPNREPSYVHRIFAEFRRSINLALESDPPVLHASPCAGVKLPTIRRKSKAYADDEFITSMRKVLHPHYMALTEVALLTGLRPGELCGLHADAVDLDAGWVEVRGVYVDHKHVIRGWPKDKDTRWVPLVDSAVTAVRGQLAGRDLTGGCGVRHADGKPCRSVVVFRNARGQAVNPEAWKAALVRAAERAGVRGRSPYSLRRGFATAAARGGIDAFELAEIMGHADVRQTREYVQQSPAARDRLRAALGGSPRLRVVG